MGRKAAPTIQALAPPNSGEFTNVTKPHSETLPSTQSKEQASKLPDCARYLNHTGVMLSDHRRVAASHHVNMMIFALLDELEVGHPSLPKPI